MFFKKIFQPAVLSAMFGLMSISPGKAAENWSFGVEPHILSAQYRNSDQRNTLLSYGLFLSADYLDSGGVKFGYNFIQVDPKAGYPEINDTNLSISGRYVHYTDSLGGKVGFRLDLYNIESRRKFSSITTTSLPNKHSQSQNQISEVIATDKTKATYTQVDFMNFSDSFYVDIGYADSDYEYADNSELDPTVLPDNTVKQVTITAGFAFNNRYDWLQSRGYFIRTQHPTFAGGVSNSNAIEFKWRHWFKPNAPVNVHSLLVKWVVGKRLFAIDPDAYSVYSIADQQAGSIATGFDWKLGDTINLVLLIGYDRYEKLSDGSPYSSRYMYGGLNIKW